MRSFWETWGRFVLIIVVFITLAVMATSILMSCDDSLSLERLKSCQDPELVGVQRRDYGFMLYHYRCADGHIVSSSVEVK